MRRQSSYTLALGFLLLSVQGCESGPDLAGPDSRGSRVSPSRVLVDASHDGGVWWFPQAGRYSPDEPHQGKTLADHLRTLGYVVNEVPREQVIGDELLSQYRIVIRAGEWGSYLPSEIEAYERFVARDVTLILLSDHRLTDATDELAMRLGVEFTGALDARHVINRFGAHPITQGLTTVPWLGGARVANGGASHIEILGWLDSGEPVMGLLHGHTARIFFMGDTNSLETIPQPLLDNLVSWGF